jgi:hypothetical protein
LNVLRFGLTIDKILRIPESPLSPGSDGFMGAAAETAWQPQFRYTTTPSGVYRHGRPHASPHYRLVEDQFDEFCTVYD